MPFHINEKGQVGKCSAQIRCPYGDFETEHYTTEAEAFRAYEAAMSGKQFKPGLQKNKDETAFEKFKNKKLDKLRKLEKKGKIPSVLQEVNHGFYADLSEVEVAMDELKQAQERPRYWDSGPIDFPKLWGGELQQVNSIPTEGVAILLLKTEDGPLKVTVNLDEKGNLDHESKLWVDLPSHEDKKVREMEVNEYNMAASSELVLTDQVRTFGSSRLSTFWYRDSDGTETFLNWSPKHKISYWSRTYRSMLDDAKKAEIANPHTFALTRFVKQIPSPKYNDKTFWKFEDTGDYHTARLVMALVTQDDSYGLSHLDQVCLREAFPEGERPFIDYTFKDLGVKK